MRRRVHADRLANLSVRRVRQDAAVEQDHCRQGILACGGLAEQALPIRAVRGVEAKRNAVTSEQFAQFMRPRLPLRADDADNLQPRQVRSAPLVKLLGDKPVEVLVWWRPGLHHVGVNVTKDRRLQHRLEARLVAPGDEQHPPGAWMELPDPGKQLRPGRSG